MRRTDIDLASALYQIQALSQQISAEDGKETIKSYKAPWLKNAKEVFRVGGRFASKQIAKAGEVVEKSAVDAVAGINRRQIGEQIPDGIADAVSKAAAISVVKEVEGNIKKAATAIPKAVEKASEVGKDRLQAAKDIRAVESARVAKGFPPMSAEQQANLINAEYHRKQAARADNPNPTKRNNARMLVENVKAAKAAIGVSNDMMDKVIQGVGIEKDKAAQIAKDFKKRASEITPENIAQKIGEFIDDCKLEPKGDPIGELYTYLHATSSILGAVGGLVGSEGAVALALAPIAPEVAMITIGANLASATASMGAMAMNLGEDQERTAGAAAYYAVMAIEGAGAVKALAKLGSNATKMFVTNRKNWDKAGKVGKDTRKVYEKASAAWKEAVGAKKGSVSYKADKTWNPSPMKNAAPQGPALPGSSSNLPKLPPGKPKVPPAVSQALKKIGLSDDLLSKSPKEIENIIESFKAQLLKENTPVAKEKLQAYESLLKALKSVS